MADDDQLDSDEAAELEKLLGEAEDQEGGGPAILAGGFSANYSPAKNDHHYAFNFTHRDIGLGRRDLLFSAG